MVAKDIDIAPCLWKRRLNGSTRIGEGTVGGVSGFKSRVLKFKLSLFLLLTAYSLLLSILGPLLGDVEGPKIESSKL